MRVPIDWLKELITFRSGPDQLAQMLTGGGLETILLPDDVLEIDVLPNRADAWSVRGIAREVSALTKFKTKDVTFKVKESAKKVTDFVKVEVRDKDLCPRYMARVIKNVKIVDSPEWLKKRLERAGIRSINNVVDVTNYLLHELGQPMHAFDANLIKEQFIVVRRANPGEKVVTLDGKEHNLDPDTLVIADQEKIIAVAGIMGAANTEVNKETKTIILESAYFNPISIHKTSKLIKTRTESSVRFEHGVDWNVVEEALDRGAAMIAELGRGEIYKGKIDVIGKEVKPIVIELRTDRVNKLLGTDISVGDMTSILGRLGFEFKKIDSTRLKVTVPLFRLMDIEREIDLIEEIARIWGYNRIVGTMPNTAFAGKEMDKQDIFHQKIREVLVGSGLNEAQTYSMVGPKDFEKSGFPLEAAVGIANPLAIESSLMRPAILPGLLNVLTHNQNRQVENVFVFELGKVFKPEEMWHLGGVLSGSPFLSALDKGEIDYAYLKGILENLFKALNIKLPRVMETNNPILQPGKGAEIEGIGVFGALHPNLLHNYEFTKPVFVFEFNLESLYKLSGQEPKYTQLPKFPPSARDISMFIPAELEHQMIIQLIKRVGGELVEDVFPFDKYKDSIAYRVIYRHLDRTLTEDEVNAKHQEIVNALVSKLMVKIR